MQIQIYKRNWNFVFIKSLNIDEDDKGDDEVDWRGLKRKKRHEKQEHKEEENGKKKNNENESEKIEESKK